MGLKKKVKPAKTRKVNKDCYTVEFSLPLYIKKRKRPYILNLLTCCALMHSYQWKFLIFLYNELMIFQTLEMQKSIFALISLDYYFA